MDYEFNLEQNKKITTAVVGARASALALWVFAMFKGGVGITHGSAIGGIFYLVFSGILGSWFWSAANALDKIVKTEGDDVIHLIAAFGHLSKIFGGIRNVQIIALVFIIGGFGIAMVLGASMLSQMLHHLGRSPSRPRLGVTH